MLFDVFCLGLIALFALLGIFRGLLRQIFGVVGFVGGIVLARMFAQPFGDAFAKDLGVPNAVATTAMAFAIFLSVAIVARLVGGFLHKRMSGGFTGGVNSLGGFVVGGGKGVLIAWALASAIALLRPHLQHLERDTPAKNLDLGNSRVIIAATETNLISELRGARASRKP